MFVNWQHMLLPVLVFPIRVFSDPPHLIILRSLPYRVSLFWKLIIDLLPTHGLGRFSTGPFQIRSGILDPWTSLPYIRPLISHIAFPTQTEEEKPFICPGWNQLLNPKFPQTMLAMPQLILYMFQQSGSVCGNVGFKCYFNHTQTFSG